MHNTTLDDAHRPSCTPMPDIRHFVWSSLKYCPITVTPLPPATGPELGINTSITMWSAYSKSICWPTAMSFLPSCRWTVPALPLRGLVHAKDEDEITFTSLTATLSNKHLRPAALALPRSSPIIVINVPPCTLPKLGHNLCTFTAPITCTSRLFCPSSTPLLLTCRLNLAGYATCIAQIALALLCRTQGTQVSPPIRIETPSTKPFPVIVTIASLRPAITIDGCTESSSGSISY